MTYYGIYWQEHPCFWSCVGEISAEPNTFVDAMEQRFCGEWRDVATRSRRPRSPRVQRGVRRQRREEVLLSPAAVHTRDLMQSLLAAKEVNMHMIPGTYDGSHGVLTSPMIALALGDRFDGGCHVS